MIPWSPWFGIRPRVCVWRVGGACWGVMEGAAGGSGPGWRVGAAGAGVSLSLSFLVCEVEKMESSRGLWRGELQIEGGSLFVYCQARC